MLPLPLDICKRMHSEFVCACKKLKLSNLSFLKVKTLSLKEKRRQSELENSKLGEGEYIEQYYSYKENESSW